MRRSRSEAAETRRRIVSTASRMFLTQGMAAVGMREIMGAEQMTPGGFYKHFNSKEELVAEANQHAFDAMIDTAESLTAGKSAEEAIRMVVAGYLYQAKGDDRLFLCPLAMLGTELSHTDDRVRAVAEDGYDRVVKTITDRLPAMPPAERALKASGIVSVMVGAVLLANIVREHATATTILQNAQTAIERML